MSQAQTEAVVVRLECVDAESREEQGGSVPSVGCVWSSRCWDEAVWCRLGVLGKKREIFPPWSGFEESLQGFSWHLVF